MAMIRLIPGPTTTLGSARASNFTMLTSTMRLEINMRKLLLAIALGSFAVVASAQNTTPPSGSTGKVPAQGQPPSGHHHPPPQAIAACQGKASGDACSFIGRENQTRTGTCFAPPAAANGQPIDQGARPLACRPPRPEGAGQGNQPTQGK